jgi:hypothetical protein
MEILLNSKPMNYVLNRLLQFKKNILSSDLLLIYLITLHHIGKITSNVIWHDNSDWLIVKDMWQEVQCMWPVCEVLSRHMHGKDSLTKTRIKYLQITMQD